VKTQIIQLNKSDDYLSVRDKMDWSQARYILLVWPKKGVVLQRKLDLTLLRQHAISLGTQLALVTKDAQVRFFARQVNLPVFSNLQQAQSTDWSNTQPKEFTMDRNSQYARLEKLRQDFTERTPSWREHPATRVLCLSICVIALFSLAGFILPGATITITPKVESQSMIFDIIADPSITMINYSTGSLPTYNLEAVVGGQETISSSGTVPFPDQPARGNLSFSNKSNQDITIPAGTIVATQGRNPIRFIITSSIDRIVGPNQTVVLEAQAMKPGLSGNLPKNRLVVFEGVLSSTLSVTNLSPTTGGTQKIAPAPSIQDEETLRQRLLTRLEQAALGEMQTRLADDDRIITPTLTLIDTKTEVYFPERGEPGNQLKLSMEVRFQAQVVSSETLHQLVEPIMDSYTPKGYLAVPHTLAFSQPDRLSLMVDGKAHWTINATRKIRADIPGTQVIESLTGIPSAQAAERLSTSFPLAEQAQIILTPSWWPRLPWLGMRIEVIQSENQ
jgi:hypothetical protein